MIDNLQAKIKKNFFNVDERSKKMRKNTLGMLIIRGLSIFLSLFSAPIMLRYVDRSDYGVLLTLTSIVNWVALLDIGLGNGLRNKLTGYLATGDLKSAKGAVSSCYGALAIYVAILIAIFVVVSPFCNWVSILNSPGSDERELWGLANVVFITFCINFLFGLLNSILYAYQMPAVNSVFSLIGQIIALLALIIQVFVFHVSSIFQIGSVNCLIPPLVTFAGSVFLFKGKLKDVAPSLKLVKLSSVKGILSLGVKFFILQIITIVLFQANAIIITQTVGPTAVVEYNLAFKYISVATMIFSFVVAPVWSATTDAYVRGDYEWIKRTVRYMRKICIIIIGVGILMVIFSKPVFNIWLGKGVIDIHYSTTALIMTYLSFQMLYKVYGTIINGIGKLFAQMIITSVIAIVYIPLAVVLGKSIGLAGVLVANNIVFLCNYLWSKLQYHKLITGTASRFWNE